MSTSKRDISGVFDQEGQNTEQRLTLCANTLKFRKNGVEFLSHKPFPVWSEMTVDIESADGRKVRGSGVVVSCEGTKHNGYVVSFIFMNLSKQSQERLSSLAL